jgi:hypothetical protein
VLIFGELGMMLRVGSRSILDLVDQRFAAIAPAKVQPLAQIPAPRPRARSRTSRLRTGKWSIEPLSLAVPVLLFPFSPRSAPTPAPRPSRRKSPRAKIAEYVAQTRYVVLFGEKSMREDKARSGGPRIDGKAPEAPQLVDALSIDDIESETELALELGLPLAGHEPWRRRTSICSPCASSPTQDSLMAVRSG